MLGFERCLSLSAHIWEMRIVVVPTPEAAVMAGGGEVVTHMEVPAAR